MLWCGEDSWRNGTWSEVKSAEPGTRRRGITGAGLLQLEVHRDADAAGGLLAALDRRVEPPFARGVHRCAIQIAVAAGLLDRHVGDVAVGVHVDDQDDGALHALLVGARRVLRRVHVLGRNVHARTDVRLRRRRCGRCGRRRLDINLGSFLEHHRRLFRRRRDRRWLRRRQLLDFLRLGRFRRRRRRWWWWWWWLDDHHAGDIFFLLLLSRWRHRCEQQQQRGKVHGDHEGVASDARPVQADIVIIFIGRPQALGHAREARVGPGAEAPEEVKVPSRGGGGNLEAYNKPVIGYQCRNRVITWYR